MSFLAQVSVLILTYNESPNIGRTLDALKGFPEIVVLDSGSTDDTLQIAARYPNVRFSHRPFDNQSGQWSYGLNSCALERDWVLALDADYVMSQALVDELAALAPPETQGGYRASFQYCVFGRPLSRTLYPPVTVLYRRRLAHYVQDGHTQRVVVQGPVTELKGRIQHDDRKPLERWLISQARYAVQEADHLLTTPTSQLRTQDRIRRLIVVAPWLVPLYCMTVGRGVLDGWPGIYYALQRGVAEAILAIHLLERRFRAKQ